MDFSQFRSGDIQGLLNEAASITAQMGLPEVDVPAFFIAMQQAYPDEVKTFLERSGVDANTLFTSVAQLITQQAYTMRGTHTLGLSPSMVSMLELALRIEAKIPVMTLNHGGLLLAVFLLRGPLRTLAESLGINSTRMQAAVTPDPSAAAPATPTAPTGPATRTVRPASSAPAGTGTQRSEDSTQACNCPTISQFCTNWLELARRGEIKPAVGRDEEIRRVLQILAREGKNNPVLVGEPGTGKTAVVEGLAHRLLNKEVPADVAGLKLYQLDLGVISGIDNSEDIMRKIIEEVKTDPQIVLFIDEIHMLIGTGSCSRNTIANILKPEMARGSVKILGATTLDEYTSHIEKDSAFERRCQVVRVDEPDVETAITILKGIKGRYENHHGVTIPDSVVECAVKLSDRYVTDRRLPDKAIDLIDEAAACLRLDDVSDVLSEEDVMAVVTAWTGIPMQSVDEDDTERLKHIEEALHQSVIGQDAAISAVANAIRRNRMGFGDPERPIGSFLFLGTTGVGKTELCKALAEYLFRSRDMIVRIDMSEYQQEHSGARLFGAPPGYVGYEQGGQLTEAVRRKPYSLVLFDEIEKAHPKIFETLLQVLDDGRMTDGKGRVVNFKNTIIVMTSNMGQSIIMRNLAGQVPDEAVVEQTTEAVMNQMKRTVAPEFINRIDNIVMFLPLTKDDVKKIAELMINSEFKGKNVTYTQAVIDYLVEEGYDPEYGARPVERAIKERIINAVTAAMLNNRIDRRLPILCDVQNGQVVISNA